MYVKMALVWRMLSILVRNGCSERKERRTDVYAHSLPWSSCSLGGHWICQRSIQTTPYWQDLYVQSVYWTSGTNSDSFERPWLCG
jgi:hypothetical protein